MVTDLTLEQIERLRDLRYRRTPERRVTTEREALAYVNEVGFCYLFGDRAVEMPTLWAAVCGRRREVPSHHHDEELGRTWHWKDSLPTRGAVYYGKLLRGKPTLVSLALLPTFYALSPNYGGLDDYLQQYEDGLLSAEARAVYEALLREGAQPTSHLRRLAGMPGGGANARRFDRALAELQTQLKIVKVGISDANRWGYAYVYDLFLRRFPEVPEAARAISTPEAMARLLTRYLRNVIAQPERDVQRLFRWEPFEWEGLMTRLIDERRIRRGVRVEGLSDSCLTLGEAAQADLG